MTEFVVRIPILFPAPLWAFQAFLGILGVLGVYYVWKFIKGIIID